MPSLRVIVASGALTGTAVFGAGAGYRLMSALGPTGFDGAGPASAPAPTARTAGDTSTSVVTAPSSAPPAITVDPATTVDLPSSVVTATSAAPPAITVDPPTSVDTTTFVDMAATGDPPRARAPRPAAAAPPGRRSPSGRAAPAHDGSGRRPES